MWVYWRILRPLLQQSWTARVAATIALVLLTLALIGWRAHWSYVVTLFVWGLIWAVTAAGAWAINR